MKNDLYTLRWHLKHWSSDSKAAALRIVAKMLGETDPQERETNSQSALKRTNARKMWYPDAQTDFPESKTRGRYPAGGPEGAIIHWTAGRPSQTLEQALSYQAKQGYTYFAIDAEGNVGQNFRLDRWGYHAGKSRYGNLGSYVSNRVVGIEVICPGMLDSRRTAWYDRTESYEVELTRESRRNQNTAPGIYYKYTQAQENALTRLILWLWSNFDCFDIGYVLGHDEVSPGRKVDPGASLSMTMPEYRQKLRMLANNGGFPDQSDA